MGKTSGAGIDLTLHYHSTLVSSLYPTLLATDAAVPMLHERVIQGDAAGVTGAAHDPRERELVTAATYVK